MKKMLLQLLAAILPVAGFAQNAPVADAAKAKEIQNAVVYLLTKAENNFEGMRGAEVTKEESFVMYAATAQPKMYAQNYYITYVNNNKRSFYMAYYTDPKDIAVAKAAITDIPKLGDKWKIEAVKSNNSAVNISYLYYNGARVGQLRDDLTAKSFAFSIGLFDNTVNAPAKATVAATEPVKTTSPEATKIKEIQSAIADLVSKATSNFETIKGSENESSLYSVMYNVPAAPKLNAQANYINYCKANGRSYFVAYYMMPKEEIDVVLSAFINMPDYGSKWKFEQVKKEDKYDDVSMFVNLVYLYYDGVKITQLRKCERGDPTEYFFLLSIGLFDKTSVIKPAYDPITHPLHTYLQSQHLTVSNNMITVKNWGPKFDGDYDVTKLATDSCVSGNCSDGHGRKVLASISNNIPHIRIMEGKFKNKVFLGDGDMLIDGEGPVVDGTYELGKFKVSYTHNTLESSAVFYPKDFNEKVEGIFNGYLDGGIGKALPTYQKFVVCEFRPAYDGKNKSASKWNNEIYSKDVDLGPAVFYLSKEYMAAYDKMKASTNQQEYTNNPSPTPGRRSGGQTQASPIRRMCGACGGTGKTYHNVTEYTYYGNNRVANSRRVPETCSACHGSGYVQ
ncbi:zinc finger-like domain-containing protein [Mucilaginibacter flavidus]|uniref:zinc finger-like domain-containing protein n=1 Tax=Mucilaginibacter flavidus TaxID=2949309 RepID=UPI0020937CD4|nr:zinc finger-like domain-containing protein [Mucilaginibacter flavidus]MCO5949891.1 hypothetical protein [Mucilaginibacter flavidus]